MITTGNNQEANRKTNQEKSQFEEQKEEDEGENIIEDSNSQPSNSNENNNNNIQYNTNNNDFLILKENPQRTPKIYSRLVKFRYSSSSQIKKAAVEKEESQSRDDDDNEEETTKNLRQRLDRFLFVGNKTLYLELFLSIITLISFIFYIVCTYKIELFHCLNYFDLGLCFIYLLDYLLKTILSHHVLIYLLSLESLVNLIIMIPPLFFFITNDYMHHWYYIIINFTRVFRVLRIFRIFNQYKNEENNVNKQIIMIIITLLQVIFISSGIIQLVEHSEVEQKMKLAQTLISRINMHMRTEFHHYVYFIVVTISTVGYGDIFPLTPLGKGIFMIIVLIIIVLIPYQTNDLVQLMTAQSDYARHTYKASREIPHIVLTGEISLESLKSFLQELFHPDHGTQYRHAVIICTEIPSREMEIFLNEKPYENFIFYLQGNPLNEKDLIRADAHKAKACIIFNNKNSKDPYTGDHQSLFLGIFIKKFVYNYNMDQSYHFTDLNDLLFYSNTQFRLCMQLNKPESSCHYTNTLQQLYKKRMKPDQLIVIESIKMNLLSKSCLTPGIMALITNLVISSGDLNDKNEAEWLKEYSEGRGHEIYRIQLLNYYKKMTFLEVVENIYTQAQAIAFAFEVEVGGTSIIKLNPTSAMKINDIIQRVKDSCDKAKESQTGDNNNNNNTSRKNNCNSIQEINSSREKLMNTIDNNRIKVFAYIICSDKAIADEIVNKEKESNNNPNELISTNPNMFQSLLVPSGNSKGKENNIGNAYNNFYANYQSDSDSEDEEEDDNNDIIQFGLSDLDFNKNDYYFNQSNEHYKTNIEVMHHSIKDREDIINHIIICGLHPALVHFILPLRAKYLQEEGLKWIVILAPSLPQHLFESFTKFPRIVFIQGSPLLPENLFRANIMNADKAVILSSGESKVIKNQSAESKLSHLTSTEEQMLDAETIFIYKAIKKCNRNIQIMTELVCTNNIEYLLNTTNLEKLFFKEDLSSQYEFTPIYASGEVFIPSIIDLITCQSYYNPHIVTIIDLFLGGDRLPTKKTKKLEETAKLGGSNLYLVKIPDAYVNESFGEFFYYLIHHHHSIGIALYRKNIIEEFYYVYTNPKKTTLLRDCDFVFVLSTNNSIYDLIDERPIAGCEVVNEMIEGDKSVNLSRSDSDTIIDEGEGVIVDSINIKSSINALQQNSNPLIQSRRKHMFATSKVDNVRRASIILTEKENFMNQVNKLEQKMKPTETSKNPALENLKERLRMINKDLNVLRSSFINLPNYIEEVVEKEFQCELMVYLAKND